MQEHAKVAAEQNNTNTAANNAFLILVFIAP